MQRVTHAAFAPGGDALSLAAARPAIQMNLHLVGGLEYSFIFP